MSADDTRTPTAERIVELIRDSRIAMLTSVAADGDLLSRPMTVQEVTDSGDMWFFIQRTSDQATAIGRNPTVNVSFASSGTWISVAGRASVVQDRAKAEELWNSMVEAWFDRGKDDPEVALLRVDSTSAEYWDSPGGRLASLITFVKAKAGGEPVRGENDATRLA